jgi:hypothetical protein
MPAAQSAIILILLARFVCELASALVQHGQHGDVTVSFVRPINNSLMPSHITHVTVQVQILNMWFEGKSISAFHHCIEVGFFVFCPRSIEAGLIVVLSSLLSPSCPPLL